MFYWIYDVPSPLLAAIFCLTFVGFAWSGVILTHARVRNWVKPQPDWNTVMGYVLSCFGVFYGIMLGLIAVGTYQNFEEVDQTVTWEASTLGTLYRDVSSYPEPIRGELQARLRQYCRYVIEEAWPAQQRGVIAEDGTMLVTDFQRKLLAFEPETTGQEILHAETVREFNNFVEARRERLNGVSAGLPAEMWYVVAIGAVLSIMLTWLFALESLSVHLTLSGVIALFIGLAVFLVAAMDHPLRGTISIPPDAFEVLLRTLMKPP